MKPRIIFPDPMLAVVEYLRTEFADANLPIAANVTIGTKVPQDKTIDKSYLPFILVRLDGSTLTKQVDESATIRISVWHETEAKGLTLAQTCRALLLSHEGSSTIRVVQPLTGVIPTSDPESGDPLSFFTVAVRLRPSNL